MSNIPIFLRRLVIQRAGDRCEYCGLSQEGQEATFDIDHVVPVIAGGATVPENLALACVSCSLRKGARTMAIDPVSGEDVTLFHPRRERWGDHFGWNGARVVALTPMGRATIEALQLNRPIIVAIRLEESLRGRHPPPHRQGE